MTPKQCADKVAPFLNQYDESGTEHTDAVDLITDVMHYAHQRGWDTDEILRSAQLHFEAELEE